MNNILESKTNYLIIKENNLIKLFSYKSLVAIYDTENRTFKDVPYTFININGVSSSYSETTSRHLTKFKNYILNRGL